MKTIHLTYPHDFVRNELPETVCAIGFFDGLHKGHVKVIETAVNLAKEQGFESAVVTFHPHPRVVLSKQADDVKYITTLEEKERLLKELSVDRLYIITFNQELSLLSPQAFVEHFLIGLHMKHVVAGFDYSYGYKGEGRMEDMEALANGRLKTTTVAKVEEQGEKVSSTRIRKLLTKGHVADVNDLLGRPFRIEGEVIHGKKRGRTIGYPTANLKIDETSFTPAVGIYAVRVIYENKTYDAMASIGYNPTFKDNRTDVSIEVNIFDFDKFIYGENLVVEWYAYIRDEIKFSSVESLIERLEQDERETKSILNSKDNA